MTADGEVVPLGPVDKEGHRVPLDTTSLYVHLIRPDTFGALMNDIEAATNCPSSEEPTHAYNVVSGMCDACADRCGGTLCQSMALHNICNRIHSLLAGDGE